MRRALLSAVLLLSPVAKADEGTWLVNHFPSAEVKKRYGFMPSAEWLHNVQLAAVRLPGICSASFASAEGLLLMVNQCARRCLSQISTPNDDRVKLGFYASDEDDEVRCPDVEADDLVEIKDVTAEIKKATVGLEGKSANDAQQEASLRLEKACADQDPHPDRVRCEVVTLFHGGRYDLYKYRRYQDVRMVFSVEMSAAFFGGDPDNFNFPRYDLDLAMMRVYEDGKPIHPPAHFKLSAAGSKPGDLTFLVGNPGGSNRAWTMAQLAYERDVAGPENLVRLSELRGVLTGYQQLGPEEKRHSGDLLFSVENSVKLYKGRFQALTDPALMEPKAKAEAALRARIAASPVWKKKAGGAIDAIAKAERRMKTIRHRYYFLEQRGGLQGSLFPFARTLVRAAAERPKANADRLPEYSDAAQPAVMQKLFSAAPVYPEFETALLTFSLSKFREDLGPDDPLVRKLLGKKSPAALAKELVEGTQLTNVSVRRQLWEGGAKAVAASADPMILFAELMDADARAARKVYEDEVDSVIKQNLAVLSEARGQLLGMSTYPETTTTLRLNYGQVKGYRENGSEVQPYTTFGGAFDRATGEAPFDLPPSWLKAKPGIKLDTPLNFISSNDVFAGDSGSAVINRNLEAVGVIFDGNIYNLGADFGYEGETQRSISVDSRAIFEALRHIYGADRLVKELSE